MWPPNEDKKQFRIWLYKTAVKNVWYTNPNHKQVLEKPNLELETSQTTPSLPPLNLISLCCDAFIGMRKWIIRLSDSEVNNPELTFVD